MIENLKKEDQIDRVNSKKIEGELRDTISDLFNERDQKHLAEDQAHLATGNTPDKQTAEATRESQKDLKTGVAKSGYHDPVGEVSAESELKALQEELLKNRKVITDTQRFGHQNARKLKNALKITQELVASGSLSREEAQSLVESLENSSGETATELEGSPYNSHPFANVLKIANTELINLRKYSDDELLDDKIKAFDYFLNLAPLEDIQEALEDLTELSDEPVKLTKKMLSIGKHYYETSYKDIKSAGGVFAYIDKKNQDIDSLHKTIDKLNKKLSQYEDFDKPRYRIAEIGNGVDGTGGVKDTISALFEERDRVRRR